MNLGTFEERRIRIKEIKLVAEALYEAKAKDDEILRVLMKVCDIDRETAMTALQDEKFIYSPSRELYQYLILEKGFDAHDADEFAKNARTLLVGNTELSKVSPAKMFNSINKANR
ncbi:hypothetical protein [Paenibacillus anseongense]|uniref:hypothetical protein n=1 Tax=Paenibacillus anseongense TaxID=2682845 RepID=UPI002DBDF829|nr:hypothetical protein [Paenibacillus anseongense]MEC0269041.1 hypothetical protein [Paenibacillus anseongense]